MQWSLKCVAVGEVLATHKPASNSLSLGQESSLANPDQSWHYLNGSPKEIKRRTHNRSRFPQVNPPEQQAININAAKCCPNQSPWDSIVPSDSRSQSAASRSVEIHSDEKTLHRTTSTCMDRIDYLDQFETNLQISKDGCKIRTQLFSKIKALFSSLLRMNIIVWTDSHALRFR